MSENGKPLPAMLLRGLKAEKYKLSGDRVSPEAFIPDDRQEAKRREQGLTPIGPETSINWEDEPVVVEALTRAKNGQFGVARVSVDSLKPVSDELYWERREVDGNPYHGNLVFTGPKPFQKGIASFIAMKARYS